jgi:hypothetical protein
MNNRNTGLTTLAFLLLFAARAETQNPAQVDQSEVARRLLTGDAFERGRAVTRVRRIGPERVNPQLRGALITALERENTLVAQVRARRAAGEVVPDRGNPELAAGLAHLVSAFRDPRAIPGLAGALGSSPPASSALADFGEPAAPAVLSVLETTTRVSVADDALTTLRFMAEGVGGQPLTDRTRDRIRRAAKKRLTEPQKSITTIWKAIDLAVALKDPELGGIVQSLATDRSAVVRLRNTNPELVERTQRVAAERLAGVPPLPRHTSVEDFARRWQ